VRATINAALATRRVRGTGLAAVVLALVLPTAAAAQLAVDRLEIFFEPGSGTEQVVSFGVANEGSRLVEATVYVQDWERRPDGEHVFSPSGSLAPSCGRFLRVFPQSLRLPPGGRQTVRVALEGADSLRAACWSVVFVENTPEPAQRGRQITYVTRLGVKGYGLPGGLVRDGEVDTLSLRAARPTEGRPADPRAREFALSFTNTGGQPLWAQGRIEVRRLDNSVAAQVEVPEFPVLPGARREMAVTLPALAAGRYVALALVDFGGGEIAAAQLEFDVR